MDYVTKLRSTGHKTSRMAFCAAYWSGKRPGSRASIRAEAACNWMPIWCTTDGFIRARKTAPPCARYGAARVPECSHLAHQSARSCAP